jgi:O-antigen ligase
MLKSTGDRLLQMSTVTSNKWIAPPAFAPALLRPQLEANPMQKVAFGVTALYIFLLYSRLQDFVFYLHLPGIILSIATALMFVTGNVRVISKLGVTKWTVALTFCMICSVPFSVWPGGALETIVNIWLKSILVYCVVASSIIIPRYCTRLITIAAFGILCGAVIGLAAGNVAMDRIGEINSRFGDSNEFAQVLLIGMCVMLGYSVTPGRNGLSKLLAYVSVVVMLVAFFRTGSRGGFIGLLTIALFVFIRDSVATKIGIVVLAVVVTICVMLFLPSTVKERYGMVFGGSSSENATDTAAIAAAGSAEGREYLLKQSLSITAHHPLFGVGTGMFAVSENSVAMNEGKARGSWHETHNMYTQVSSENGIPACLFFIAAIIAAFRALNRLVALGKGSVDLVIVEASRSAYWIRLALLAMISSGFFLSIAYSIELQVLLALTMGLVYSVNSHIQLSQLQPAAPSAPAPRVDFGRAGKPVRPAWSNA